MTYIFAWALVCSPFQSSIILEIGNEENGEEKFQVGCLVGILMTGLLKF